MEDDAVIDWTIVDVFVVELSQQIYLGFPLIACQSLSLQYAIRNVDTILLRILALGRTLPPCSGGE